ncbi:hypothetical protein [Pseudidiomarina mangrovi]|uniref:hypothetical protein n=1 Tax=Pseudidiomarina mangrovi TaxID=2487133 RepID=UPI000FC9DF92|nr:hypothetical protein [Pseudidiomarina mangrovi]
MRTYPTHFYNGDFHAEALEELRTGSIDQETWARAFSHSKGVKSETSALYVKIRAKQLQDIYDFKIAKKDADDEKERKIRQEEREERRSKEKEQEKIARSYREFINKTYLKINIRMVFIYILINLSIAAFVAVSHILFKASPDIKVYSTSFIDLLIRISYVLCSIFILNYLIIKFEWKLKPIPIIILAFLSKTEFRYKIFRWAIYISVFFILIDMIF